jgi:hypothetical protein
MLIGLTGSCQHAFRNESLAQFVTQLHLFHNLTIPTTAQWGSSCSERALFIAEFLRRLRKAAHGERVYMRLGDIFKDADVIDLSEWQAARRKDGRCADRGE